MKPERSRVRGDKRSENETELLRDIQGIVRSARAKAFLAVNFAMVEAHWLIGKRIVEEEQKGRARAGYGERLIRALSRGLAAEFGRGFSAVNLWNFRRFYLTYPSAEIVSTLWRQLSWSHHRLIMRVENRDAREYYIREVADQHWSVRQLERNINSLYYQRLLVSRRKSSGAARKGSPSEPARPSDHFKDPYVLEVLGLPMPPGFTEAEFEAAILFEPPAIPPGAGQGLLVRRPAAPDHDRDQAFLHRPSSPLKKSLLRLRALRLGVVTLVEPCSAAMKAASAVSLSRS